MIRMKRIMIKNRAVKRTKRVHEAVMEKRNDSLEGYAEECLSDKKGEM